MPMVPTGAPRTVLTNADGRFLFAGVPGATYAIVVTKAGYVNSGYGKLRPDGPSQPLELADGERNGDVKITIWKFAAISGVLTDEAGEPFVGATVTSLRRSYAAGRLQMVDDSTAFTDDRGFFRISTLAPGAYMIAVIASQITLPASLVDAFGQARLAGGTAAADLTRPMSTTTLGFTVPFSTPGNRIDDVVVQTVGPASRGPLSFQTTFYPSVVNMSQAEVITLGSGEERTGADIRLRLVPVASVTGTLLGPTGPLPNVGVRLVPGYSPDLGSLTSFDAARTVSDATGRFTFMGVPAGPYTLRALRVQQAQPSPIATGPNLRGGAPPVPDEPTLWANLPITVGPEGIRNLAVKVGTGFKITGKIVYEGSAAPPAPSALPSASVQVLPAEGHQIGYPLALRGVIAADGSFTTAELPPGKYIVRFTGTGGGWSLKSAMFQGRDVSYLPLTVQSTIDGVQIVMTDRPALLTGTVRDESGKNEPKAAVILFPADRAEWSSAADSLRRLKNVRVNGAGAFGISGLPAGQYLLAAVPDAQAGDWQNPATLELLSHTATAISVADGEKKTQDLVSRRIR